MSGPVLTSHVQTGDHLSTARRPRCLLPDRRTPFVPSVFRCSRLYLVHVRGSVLDRVRSYTHGSGSPTFGLCVRTLDGCRHLFPGGPARPPTPISTDLNDVRVGRWVGPWVTLSEGTDSRSLSSQNSFKTRECLLCLGFLFFEIVPGTSKYRNSANNSPRRPLSSQDGRVLGRFVSRHPIV